MMKLSDRRSTVRQQRLAREMVEEHKRKGKAGIGALMERAGYTKSTAEARCKEISESIGVRKELARLGFTEDNAKSVVSEILLSNKSDDNDRLNAADKVFKVHGSYAPEKKAIVYMEISEEQKKELDNLLQFAE